MSAGTRGTSDGDVGGKTHHQADHSSETSLKMVLQCVARGYAKLGKLLFHVLFLSAAATLVSVAIVGPLWLAATRAGEIYTVTIIALAGVVVISGVIRRVRSQSIGRLLPMLRRMGRALGSIAAVYAVVFLFARGYTSAAILITLAALLWVGYAAGGRGATRHEDGTK